MPSPRPFDRTRTFSMPSGSSRNENWSMGLPATFSALGAVPSSGMRNTAEVGPVASGPRRQVVVQTKTELAET
jgi:hypothetical protein